MSRSTKLAYLLRHDEKTYDFPHTGWRTIDDLCVNHGYTFDEILDIVRNDRKGRFEFNDERTLIRAVYGHSVDVFPDLIESPPPPILYHGTSIVSVDRIISEGIKKMSRNFVHLSSSIIEAVEVGSRHGKPVILEVNAAKMAEDSIRFWKARNDTLWLTEYVHPSYMSLLKDEDVNASNHMLSKSF